MRPVEPRRLALTILIVVALLTNSCGDQQGTAGLKAIYELPLVPIQIAYDFVSKSLEVSISGKLQTPIGTFKLSTGVEVLQRRFNGVRTLTTEVGSKKYVYRLEEGRKYSISIPSDENGGTNVVYSGLDENLTISIPNPTNETVSNLRQKLRDEQESRERERAEAEAREAELKERLEAEALAEQSEYEETLRRQAQEAEERSQRELDLRAQADEYKRELELEQQERAEAERREREAERRSQAEAARQREAEARRDEAEIRRKQERERQIIGLANRVLTEINRRQRRRR